MNLQDSFGQIISKSLAGIYLHIPFCTHRCSYCNYAVSTEKGLDDAYLKALLAEIGSRSGELQGAISTIYLGGGTPSKLSVSNLDLIISALRDSFDWASELELTLEANPEDIELDTLGDWSDLGINRLSLGIQSTFPGQLEWMKRAHDADEGMRAINAIQASPLASNYSIDLIFGLPNQSMEHWNASLELLIKEDAPHFSIYGLETIEKTSLALSVKRGALTPADEDLKAEMYLAGFDKLIAAGYHAYELASFAMEGKACRHNLHYWQHKEYLGLGLAAHSLRWQEGRAVRSSNNSNLHSYLENSLLGREEQIVDEAALANEYIMIRLRTWEGLDLLRLNEKYGYNLLGDKLELVLSFNKLGLIENAGDQRFRLTREGRQQAEPIMAALLI